MRFEALELSLEIIRKLRPIVTIIQTHDRKLAERIRTAGSSSALNLAEGNRRTGKDKLYLWHVAAGSRGDTRSGVSIRLLNCVDRCAGIPGCQ